MPILTNIGKKLVGEGAGLYLPFALSKLRYFASTKQVMPFSRTIKADDATIILELRSPTEGQVTIFSGGFDYEFTTAGNRWSPAQYAGIETTMAYAVKTRISGKTFGAKATGSTAEESPSGAWPYSDQVIDIAAKFIPHKQIWQIEHVPAHTFYPSIPDKDPSKPRALTAALTLANSWTSSTQTVNLALRSRGGRLVYNQYTFVYKRYTDMASFDFLFDIGPTLFKKDLFPEKGRGLVPDSDWYKRGAVKIVTHPVFGERTFILMTDISNNFYAYPLVDADLTMTDGSPYAPQLIKTNVRPQYVKSKAAPFPSWVRKPPSTMAREWWRTNPSTTSTEAHHRKYLLEYPQYRWSFNSTATRAACIAFFDYDEAVGMDNPNEPVQGRPGNIGQKIGLADNFGGANELRWYVRESLPGLVEVELALEITGPALEDFSFDVALGRVINPDATDTYTCAVDYSWGKRPGGPENGTTLDDMIIMQLDYYPCGSSYPVLRPDGSAPITRTINEMANMTVKNFTTGKVLKTFLQSKMYFYIGDDDFESTGFKSDYYKLKFLAYDLRTLAFMTQRMYVRNRMVGQKQIERVARKIQVSIYGEDEAPIQLSQDGELSAQMDAIEANTSTIGMTRLPPSHLADLHAHTVNPVSGTWEYTYAQDPLTRCMEWYWSGNQGVPGTDRMAYFLSGSPGTLIDTIPFPRTFMRLGAERYATTMEGTLECGVHSAFTVHPEGHWTVTSPVVVLYDGSISSISGGGWTPINPALVRQDFVDTITINVKQADGSYGFKRTTHVDMFNKAYGKQMKKSDRFYIPTVRPNALRLSHPYDASFFFDVPQNTGMGFYSVPTIDQVHGFFVRGSSIFFGQAKTRAT